MAVGKNVQSTPAGKGQAPANKQTVKVTAPPAPAPRAPIVVAPAATQAPYGNDFGGGYGGGGGGYSTGQLGSAGSFIGTGGDEDYLAGDSAYQAQIAALMRAMTDSTADFTNQRTRYDTDYNDALRTLGWTKNDAGGDWNIQDQNTASGRSRQSLDNDFASRGLLQSSLYGTSLDNLMRSLNDQLGSVNTARTNFMDDLTTQETSMKNENTLGTQQARAEALARRAAGLTL